MCENQKVIGTELKGVKQTQCLKRRGRSNDANLQGCAGCLRRLALIPVLQRSQGTAETTSGVGRTALAMLPQPGPQTEGTGKTHFSRQQNVTGMAYDDTVGRMATFGVSSLVQSQSSFFCAREL